LADAHVVERLLVAVEQHERHVGVGLRAAVVLELAVIVQRLHVGDRRDGDIELVTEERIERVDILS
jgi:hypothetical protein